MHETADPLEEQVMLAAADLLKTRNRIFVCGIGASSLIAQDIQQKWTRLGKVVIFETDYNSLLPQLIKHEKECLLWAVSNSGQTPEQMFRCKFPDRKKPICAVQQPTRLLLIFWQLMCCSMSF